MLLYKSGVKSCVNGNKIKKVSPFEFSVNTTYGLGGASPIGYMPKTVWQAKAVYDMLVRNNISFEILGNGSNVLVSDKGTNSQVISTKAMRGIVNLGDNKLLCLAGTKISDLLAYCRSKRLGGLEYMYGIPATVGGAAFMNAGVCGKSIGDNIVKVHIYNGKSSFLCNEKCGFAYRHSTMRDINALILSIIVKLNDSNLLEIDEKIAYYKSRRRHLPKGKSCGCVFKNPQGYSSGYLIEAAGLKGFRVGGAVVSDKHASFIINDCGTADDVKFLIQTVKRRVYDKFEVMLEEEVVYIGEFNEFNG